MRAKSVAPFDLNAALLSAFATNNRINCYLVENVRVEAWTEKPPEGKGRSIAAIVSHMHNVRLMWLKAIGAATVPAKVEDSASPAEAVAALKESHAALADAIKGSLTSGQVKGFKPDVVGFYTYLVAHDAHHRGQITSLARRLGHPLPQSIGFGMWEWGSRSKETDAGKTG